MKISSSGEFNQSARLDLAMKLFDCVTEEPLNEPNAFRSQAARLLAGDDQSPIVREFVSVMTNPRPMLYRLRREGVKSVDEQAQFVTLVLSTYSHLRIM